MASDQAVVSAKMCKSGSYMSLHRAGSQKWKRGRDW